MKRTLLPLLILLLWFLGCLWWWSQRCNPCKNGTAAVADSTAIAPNTDSLKHAVAPEEEVLFKPLEIYFESGKSAMKRDSVVENFLSTAKTYLAKHADEKMVITGHTDNDGSDETNQRLSLKRANQVADMLATEGFSKAQMEVVGKGESEPLAPNDTPEGKNKNRRVSVILKQ